MGERLVVPGRALGNRHALQHLAAAEEGGLHDVLAPHGMGDGATHARIGEGALGAVEQDVHERPVLRLHLQARVALDGAHRLPGHVFDQVHIARLQRRDAQVLVGIDGELHALELRETRARVFLEGHEVDGGATLLPGDAEGPGADRLVHGGFPPDDRHVVVAEPARDGGDGLLGIELQRLRVRRLEARHLLELRAHVGGGFLAGDLLDRPLHVLGRHRLAILEDGVPAQAEDPGAVLMRPGLRQLPAQFPLVVEGDQAAMDQHLHRAGGGAGAGPGLQVRREGGKAEAEDAVGRLGVAGARQERQGAARGQRGQGRRRKAAGQKGAAGGRHRQASVSGCRGRPHRARAGRRAIALPLACSA